MIGAQLLLVKCRPCSIFKAY